MGRLGQIVKRLEIEGLILLNAFELASDLSRCGMVTEDQKKISEAANNLLRRSCEFFNLFKCLSKQLEQDQSLSYVCTLGIELLCQAKEKNNGQVPTEQITELADQLIQLCEASARLQEEQVSELAKHFESETETNLLAALYACYELDACERLFYVGWINPFSWCVLAIEYIRASAGAKPGRKKLEDSPNKMKAVAKIIEENPRAPDSVLTVKLALENGIAASTAATWIKAYRKMRA